MEARGTGGHRRTSGTGEPSLWSMRGAEDVKLFRNQGLAPRSAHSGVIQLHDEVKKPVEALSLMRKDPRTHTDLPLLSHPRGW